MVRVRIIGQQERLQVVGKCTNPPTREEGRRKRARPFVALRKAARKELKEASILTAQKRVAAEVVSRILASDAGMAKRSVELCEADLQEMERKKELAIEAGLKGVKVVDPLSGAETYPFRDAEKRKNVRKSGIRVDKFENDLGAGTVPGLPGLAVFPLDPFPQFAKRHAEVVVVSEQEVSAVEAEPVHVRAEPATAVKTSCPVCPNMQDCDQGLQGWSILTCSTADCCCMADVGTANDELCKHCLINQYEAAKLKAKKKKEKKAPPVVKLLVPCKRCFLKKCECKEGPLLSKKA